MAKEINLPLLSCQPEGGISRRKYYRINRGMLNLLRSGKVKIPCGQIGRFDRPDWPLPHTESTCIETKETKETPAPSDAGAPRVSAFKRKPLNKEQSRKHLRWPRFEIPSLDEVIQYAEDNGWDKMLSVGREESAYQKLHGDRWHHWNGKRWTVVKDWKSYFSSLNHKMEQY